MDHYEILEVARSATTEEIASAYRKKAVQYHPDKNPSPEALAIFKACAEAHEVLSDTSKRSQYDIQGYVGRRPAGFKQPSKPKKPVKTAEDFAREREQQEQAHSPTRTALESINCNFFGGEATGRNILVHMFVRKDFLKTGGKSPVKIKRRDPCNRCVGDGVEKGPCPSCTVGGQFYRRDDPNRMLNMHCSLCEGAGYIEVKCSACKGEGVLRWAIYEPIVTVPANSSVGQQIRLIGEGEAAPRKLPGYVQVVLLEST